MMDYESLKEWAKEEKCSVDALVALHPRNDPFYVGTENDKRLGAWFADLWHRFGYTSGVHLRRMHYAIVSQNPPILKPDGLPYENTERCWDFLNVTSTRARYLGYVDPGAFVDRRNEEPITTWQSFKERDVDMSIDDVEEPHELVLDFPKLPTYSLDTFQSSQRYHLEIWCEKSTMNDIFKSLLWRFHAVLMFGKGELSITMALEAVQRFQRVNKPVRIFYISDFDPAGRCMPVSMARKIEYFLRRKGLGLDVKLFPVVLTHEQVKHYDRLLPTPIKDSEMRKAKFEQRYGEGAIELDALEAIYPGELRRILERELERYYDRDLDDRVSEAEEQAQQALDDAKDAVYERHQEELDEIEREEEALQTIFDEQIKERMASHTRRKYDLSMQIAIELEDSQPYITDEDAPEAAEAEEREDALFDSSLGYFDQNDVYQAYKGNEEIAS